MKSLKKIGTHWGAKQQFPAEVFWKKYDAGEFGSVPQVVPAAPADALRREHIPLGELAAAGAASRSSWRNGRL
jgi:hypothetical protein